VVKSCNYHAQAIWHIRHLLTLDLAQTLACSLILSRCTARQHQRSTSSSECRTTQLGSYSSHQDDPTPSRCFADCTGCRSSRQSFTRQQYKVPTTATPAYLSCHLQTRHSSRHLRSSSTPLLSRPSRLPPGLTLPRAASVMRNLLSGTQLPRTVLDSPSLTVFKSRLKTHLFHLANTD